MAPIISALVFGFNIQSIHSAVDLGNQSAATCELFFIVIITVLLTKAINLIGETRIKYLILIELPNKMIFHSRHDTTELASLPDSISAKRAG